MDEYGFELRLCTHLEAEREAIVARQLGGGVHTTGRVLDILLVEPGPGFDDRARLTDATIPDALLTGELGPGSFTDWRRALGAGMGARRAVDRGERIGFLEREHRGGREVVRPVDRYPEDWFGRVVAIENKPDLASPGDLYGQLQFDVSLGLVDAVVLATASHVTRAHRHRLPDEVGIWRFDPEAGEVDVVQAPEALAVDRAGVERRGRHPGWTDVAVVDAAAKADARRRLAERAYGKGWRTRSLPACANVDARHDAAPGAPWCRFKGRLVDPTAECGPACSGHAPAAPPAVDLTAVRDARQPWRRDPPDRRRRQSTLQGFED
ncbi:MAG: DUF5787 family protein [Halobacteriales archaeon]